MPEAVPSLPGINSDASQGLSEVLTGFVTEELETALRKIPVTRCGDHFKWKIDPAFLGRLDQECLHEFAKCLASLISSKEWVLKSWIDFETGEPIDCYMLLKLKKMKCVVSDY